MATRRYDPKVSLARPKQASKPERSAFWINPDVYFRPRENMEAEIGSDADKDEHQPAVFAGRVGAKGFADPHYINEVDISEATINDQLSSTSKEDLKRDLRALDHIHRESVDDVIQYYLKDSRKSPDTKKKPKEPMWSALQPPRNTRVVPSSSVSLNSSPMPVSVLPSKETVPKDKPCPCCAGVNAENVRRRKEVAPARASNIDLPTVTTLPINVARESLANQPLSTIIRKEPKISVPPPQQSDLFLIYDQDESRIAYVNYKFPEVENPSADSHRRLVEYDLMNSDGKFKDSMVRLSRQIRDLEFSQTENARTTAVNFPTGNVEPLPLSHRPVIPQRSVKFSEESPTKFLYTPLTSPDGTIHR